MNENGEQVECQSGNKGLREKWTYTIERKKQSGKWSGK